MRGQKCSLLQRRRVDSGWNLLLDATSCFLSPVSCGFLAPNEAKMLAKKNNPYVLLFFFFMMTCPNFISTVLLERKWLMKKIQGTVYMSRSSFGSFSACVAATQLTPDCSSALGWYVPSVCLFFFTTQKSHARTAKAITRTTRITVGTTMATMLGPCKWEKYKVLIHVVTLDAFEYDLLATVEVCHSRCRHWTGWNLYQL